MRIEGWTSQALPPAVVSVVRREIASVVDGIVDAVRDEHPAYDAFLGGPEGMGLRLGIEQAVRAFLDAAERGTRPTGETGEIWRRLGEAEFQSGRALEALRAAFRTGTRAAWRGAAELAAEAGITAPLVIALAEAIFVFSDELAADVVEGYVRAQTDEAGERERRRRRLAALLLDPAGHDPEALERASALARWPLPRRLGVVAAAVDSPVTISRQLDADVLSGADGEGAWLIVPDPEGPGRARALARVAEAAPVPIALGPTVTPGEAARSLRWARATLTLLRRGSITDGRPTRAQDNLASLILLHDPELAAALAERTLAPLDRLAGLERERLLATLGAWLDHQRHTPEIARALHVHPQTVRYRVRQLQELLGDVLDTPEGRFELALAVRARAANGRERPSAARSSGSRGPPRP